MKKCIHVSKYWYELTNLYIVFEYYIKENEFSKRFQTAVVKYLKNRLVTVAVTGVDREVLNYYSQIENNV